MGIGEYTYFCHASHTLEKLKIAVINQQSVNSSQETTISINNMPEAFIGIWNRTGNNSDAGIHTARNCFADGEKKYR